MNYCIRAYFSFVPHETLASYGFVAISYSNDFNYINLGSFILISMPILLNSTTSRLHDALRLLCWMNDKHGHLQYYPLSILFRLMQGQSFVTWESTKSRKPFYIQIIFSYDSNLTPRSWYWPRISLMGVWIQLPWIKNNLFLGWGGGHGRCHDPKSIRVQPS